MAGKTIGGSPAETIGMTLSAGRRYMCSGKGEFPVIMIIGSCNTAGRMAFITWDAGVSVTSYGIVLTVHIRLVVSMTINTAEGFITAWGIMAVGTGTPCPGMFS